MNLAGCGSRESVSAGSRSSRLLKLHVILTKRLARIGILVKGPLTGGGACDLRRMDD